MGTPGTKRQVGGARRAALSGPIAVALLLLLLSSAYGCDPAANISRPDAGVRDEQNRQILQRLADLGADGDWLVTMGYKPTDHLVSTATNIPISHAAVLDKSTGRVVEADGSGVHYTDLMVFVDHSHRLILIRPVWAEGKPEAGAQALQAARGWVGKKYDFTGTIGLNDPERVYCSELAVEIFRPFFKPSHRLPPVVEPGQLYLWGTILFDSRPRDWE
jgi:hypothetical protein